MRIENKHVEAMLQTLYELGARMKMAPLPLPGIIMPGKEYEQRFRCWLTPDVSDLSNESITYYEGTKQQCSIYAAELTMRLALEKVFGNVGLSLVPSEPRDSLPQTDGDLSA